MTAQMQRLIGFLTSSFLTLILLFPALSIAEEFEHGPSVGAMVGDIVFARPILFAVTAVGTVLYVVTLPVTLLFGNAEEAGEMLVMAPGEATFVRCLGCTNKDQFSNNYDELDAYGKKSKSKDLFLKGGYLASTYFNEDHGAGFNISLGGKLFKNDYAYVDIELNYYDFGAAGDDSQFDDGSREKYTANLTSVGLGTSLGVRFGDYAHLYAKFGISKWDYDVEVMNYETGGTSSRGVGFENDTDHYYGIGLGFNLTKNLNFDVEYIELPLDKVKSAGLADYKVTSLGANLALKF